MALCDWNDDGNNDLLDDYIEYQIYKDVTSEFDSNTNTYRSYPKPMKKGVLKQAMENVSKAYSVCGSVVIPDTPEFDALRRKYSDYEIKKMVSLLYRNTKEVREVLYSEMEDPDHRAMRRLVMGLGSVAAVPRNGIHYLRMVLSCHRQIERHWLPAYDRYGDSLICGYDKANEEVSDEG